MTDRYETLGRSMRGALATPPAPPVDLRARVLDAVGAGGRRGPRLRFVAFALAGAAAAGTAVLLPAAPTETALDLACSRAGRPVPVAAWLDDRNPAPLVFGDGTRMSLRQGARARLAEIGRRRVRVSLESGEIDAEVVPARGIDWLVHAGPYEVRVLGTGFVVRWDGSSLVVNVRHGRVAAARTDRDERVVLGAGAQLVADPTGMRLVGPEARAATVTPPAEGAAPAPAEAPAPATAPTTAAAPSPAAELPRPVNVSGRASADRPSQAASAPASWTVAARAGRFSEALAAADRSGIGDVLRRAPADDLLLLADSARLGRRPDLARRALETLRERYRGAAASAMAAFRLGRLEYDEGHAAEAAVWFETFAREAPQDPLAESARGRPIEAWRLAGRLDRARAAAREYLRRHPSGSYAALAREILGGTAAP